MRFLGILIIMLAHSDPPDWLFQLRNFGTPLLIVASALTFSTIYKTREMHVEQFYKKRIIRLTWPAWIFLTLFFTFFYTASLILGRNYPFSVEKTVASYTFCNGIKCVWIFKVYLILALITPFALKLKAGIRSQRPYFFILLVGYVLYEICLPAAQQLVPETSAEFFDEVVFIIIPYTILFLYGIRLDEIKTNRVLLVSGVSLCIFIGLAANKYSATGQLIGTQEYKYPRSVYYLSYAFFCLNIVYLVSKNFLVKILPPKPVIWLSANSLWIYLWHIMAMYLWEYTIGPTTGELGASIVKGIFILSFGVALTLLQKFLVQTFIATSRAPAVNRLAVVLS
jgi:peptidoglycan/LPS O-acetylase OafA/YrhL